MNESTQVNRDMTIMNKVIQDISEHFDYCQIFAGRYEGDNQSTISINKGMGNWIARTGQIREWLIYQDERIRVQAREDAQEEDDE